ncbi:MAG: hypothetical protein M3O25_07115, partial [Actinomycetota bacterium]|nr:hypothetical protein [Actinomycetota bacterium]
MRRTLWLLGLAVAIASIAAGCGDDDDSSDGGSEAAPLTKAEFVTEADKVCSEANAQTQTEVSELLQGSAPSPENLPD